MPPSCGGGGSSFRPQAFEQPPQQVAPRDRDRRERGADDQVLSERDLQPDRREHHELHRQRHKVAHHDIGDRLDQRHGAALPHGSRSSATSRKVRPSASSTASSPVKACQRSTATALHLSEAGDDIGAAERREIVDRLPLSLEPVRSRPAASSDRDVTEAPRSREDRLPTSLVSRGGAVVD